MIAKVNAKIELKNDGSIYLVKLFDVDVIKDDEIGSIEINQSKEIEFFFSLGETGEINPELQIRIYDSKNNEVYRSGENNSISSDNKIGGFVDHTTIDFGLITI